MKGAVNAGLRLLRSIRRPSKARNTRLLRARGETAISLVIRDAAASDIPAVARLHVETWNATHSWRKKGPTYELREHQWRDAFGHADGSWFCLVVERANSELVGFAKGMRREYQRQGLGRRLVGYVARRFLSQGITSMVLFGDATNPSCGFWEALLGERLCSASGDFHGGYAWRDLRTLASLCQGE